MAKDRTRAATKILLAEISLQLFAGGFPGQIDK